MTLYLAALLLGIVAGLRAVTPVAAVSWAAALGLLNLADTPLAFLGAPAAPWIVSALALGELVTDKLPQTPSRKIPPAFGARIVSGGFVGAALGLAAGAAWPIAAVVGALGAVGGTYGGAAARATLARAFGRDLPAALVEDLVAVAGAALVVSLLL